MLYSGVLLDEARAMRVAGRTNEAIVKYQEVVKTRLLQDASTEEVRTASKQFLQELSTAKKKTPNKK